MTEEPIEEPAEEPAAADHLVAAGTELIAAARGFLDSVERSLADPSRVAAAIDSINGLVESAGSALSRLAESVDTRHDPSPTDQTDDDRRPSRRLRSVEVEFSDDSSSHVGGNRADI